MRQDAKFAADAGVLACYLQYFNIVSEATHYVDARTSTNSGISR